MTMEQLESEINISPIYFFKENGLCISKGNNYENRVILGKRDLPKLIEMIKECFGISLFESPCTENEINVG